MHCIIKAKVFFVAHIYIFVGWYTIHMAFLQNMNNVLIFFTEIYIFVDWYTIHMAFLQKYE